MNNAYFLNWPNRITITSFGGTFIGGGQLGRKGLFMPENEDSMEDRLFVTGNDPLRPLTSDEFEGLCEYINYSHNGDREASLAQMLIRANATEEKIDAAAEVVLTHPELLATLYVEGCNVNGVEEWVKRAARKKIFGLLWNIFTAMLATASAKSIRRSLNFHRNGARTTFEQLTHFARNEAQHGGYGHWTATNILKELDCAIN